MESERGREAVRERGGERVERERGGGGGRDCSLQT